MLFKRISRLSLLILPALGYAVWSFSCSTSTPDPMVVMFCLDGATEDLIDELRSERKLPTLDKLIRSGTYGSLRSWAAKRIMSDDRRRGYWSPIIWTTISRWRGLLSNSAKTTCCHVPSISLPFSNGMTNDGPWSAALT